MRKTSIEEISENNAQHHIGLYKYKNVTMLEYFPSDKSKAVLLKGIKVGRKTTQGVQFYILTEQDVIDMIIPRII